MKINKGSFLHEVLILVLYIILSPILFSIFYPVSVSGDGALIYVFILMITCLTALISLILIYKFKKLVNTDKFELAIGLMTLIISFSVFILMSSTSYSIITTFFKSNIIDIVISYGISITYKLIGKSDL